MNKPISFPIAIIIIIVLAVLVGGLVIWQYLGMPKEEEEISEVAPEDEIADWKTEEINKKIEACDYYSVNCVAAIAIENNNVDLCKEKYNKQPSMLNICFAIFALYYDNSEICQKLSNEYAQEDCFYYFGKEKAKENDYESCMQISDETAQRICSFHLANNNNNVEFCDGDSTCVLNLVVKAKDPELCKKIKDIEAREFCYGSFNIDNSDWISYTNSEFSFEFKYPENFFGPGSPRVIISDCNDVNFPEECPDVWGIEDLSYEHPQIKLAAGPSDQGKIIINNTNYCYLEVYEGRGYSRNYYTTIKNGQCLTIYWTITFGPCGLFYIEEEGYQKCSISNMKKSNILKEMLSTFKFLD